jgi:hypothetical protein
LKKGNGEKEWQDDRSCGLLRKNMRTDQTLEKQAETWYTKMRSAMDGAIYILPS